MERLPRRPLLCTIALVLFGFIIAVSDLFFVSFPALSPSHYDGMFVYECEQNDGLYGHSKLTRVE